MNARRVPFEAPKERSRVGFGGFRPTKHVEEPRALARGAPLTLNMLESLFQTFVNAFWRSEITVIEDVKM